MKPNYDQIYEESDYDAQEAKSIGGSIFFWLGTIIAVALALALYIIL